VVLAGGKIENARITWMLTRWATRMTIALLRGGLALRLTAPAWGQVWREQEYEADRFAAHIGWGEKLADFLEAEQLKHDHPIPRCEVELVRKVRLSPNLVHRLRLREAELREAVFAHVRSSAPDAIADGCRAHSVRPGAHGRVVGDRRASEGRRGLGCRLHERQVEIEIALRIQALRQRREENDAGPAHKGRVSFSPAFANNMWN
jgi:hypothetical protein